MNRASVASTQRPYVNVDEFTKLPLLTASSSSLATRTSTTSLTGSGSRSNDSSSSSSSSTPSSYPSSITSSVLSQLERIVIDVDNETMEELPLLWTAVAESSQAFQKSTNTAARTFKTTKENTTAAAAAASASSRSPALSQSAPQQHRHATHPITPAQDCAVETLQRGTSSTAVHHTAANIHNLQASTEDNTRTTVQGSQGTTAATSPLPSGGANINTGTSTRSTKTKRSRSRSTSREAGVAAHAQFVREVSSLLWGADYPRWLEELWMRQGDAVEGEEEEEEEEEEEVNNDNSGDDVSDTQSAHEKAAQDALPPPGAVATVRNKEENGAEEQPQPEVAQLPARSTASPPVALSNQALAGSADNKGFALFEEEEEKEKKTHHINTDKEGRTRTCMTEESDEQTLPHSQQQQQLTSQLEATSTGLAVMMQQALDALQLSLPLMEAPHPSSSSSSSPAHARPSASPPPPPSASRDTKESDTNLKNISKSQSRSKKASRSSSPSTPQSAVDTLAQHLVQDAPLLWLRYLLVPMYQQWTQVRARTLSEEKSKHVAHDATRSAQPVREAAAASDDVTASSSSFASSPQWMGAVTMHRLLHALSTSSLKEALRKEKQYADALLEQVNAMPETKDASNSAGSHAKKPGPSAGVSFAGDARHNNGRSAGGSLRRTPTPHTLSATTTTTTTTSAAAATAGDVTNEIRSTSALKTTNSVSTFTTISSVEVGSEDVNPTSRASADHKTAAAREAVHVLQHDQRQHVSRLLCFFGTLARVTQSYTLLCGGAFTLINVSVVRLLGAARAAWGEWGRGCTVADFNRDGPFRTMLRRTRENAGSDDANVFFTETQKVDERSDKNKINVDGPNHASTVNSAPANGEGTHHREEGQPRKRHRGELVWYTNAVQMRVEATDSLNGTSASPMKAFMDTNNDYSSGDHRQTRGVAAESGFLHAEKSLQSPATTATALPATDTLAALRRHLSDVAHQHAAQLWRAWSLLFGLYGSDLYTDATIARALQEEEMAAAGVAHMPAAQQAQWHKIRFGQRLKQHALSETHYLTCLVLLSYVEDTMGEFMARESSKSGSMTLLYRRLLADVLRTFFHEVRDVLGMYGQSALALRSGGLEGATTVVPETLRAITNNVLGLQLPFHQFVLDDFAWSALLRTSPDQEEEPKEKKEEVNGEAEHRQNAGVPARGTVCQHDRISLQAGTYLWQLYPSLLRTQSPDEVSWMSNAGAMQNAYTGADGAAAAGGVGLRESNVGGGGLVTGEEGEVASEEFHERQDRFWRQRGGRLNRLLVDTRARMEVALTQIENAEAAAAATHAAALDGHESDEDEYANDLLWDYEDYSNNNIKNSHENKDAHFCNTDASAVLRDGRDYAAMVQMFSDVICADEIPVRPAPTESSKSSGRATTTLAMSGVAPTSGGLTSLSGSSPLREHPLDSVVELFPIVYDASCFFVLQPERQRLFTRSIQKLCDLVAGKTAFHQTRNCQVATTSCRDETSRSDVDGDGKEATQEEREDTEETTEEETERRLLFVSSLRHDTRLWMLLLHGLLLQLERRGRLAREDESLLATGLLPLLSVLSSPEHTISPTTTTTTTTAEAEILNDVHTRAGKPKTAAAAAQSTRTTTTATKAETAAQADHFLPESDDKNVTQTCNTDNNINSSTGGFGSDGKRSGEEVFTWPAWADVVTGQELLLLMGSGLLSLPWSVEGIYAAVRRHTLLCTRYGQHPLPPAAFRSPTTTSSGLSFAPLSPSAPTASSSTAAEATLRSAVNTTASLWFHANAATAVEGAKSRTAASSTSSPATAAAAARDRWSFSTAENVTSSPMGGRGPHTLSVPSSPSAIPATTDAHMRSSGECVRRLLPPLSLSDLCQLMDAELRHSDTFLRQLHASEDARREGDVSHKNTSRTFHFDRTMRQPTSTTSTAGSTHNTKICSSISSSGGGGGDRTHYLTSTTTGGSQAAVDVSEDAVDRYLRHALRQHALLTADFTTNGTGGALIVVGAYRSLSRGLYRLRAAVEGQRRMAREDDAGEFVGRTATFCTTDDVHICQTLFTVVHHTVFAQHAQPRGLLHLWFGYLQQLFICVVPSSSSSSGAAASASAAPSAVQDGRSITGEAETLVLMPNSWQKRHRVTSLFNQRVFRVGWRALQHDGEPTSHTRLREALGESLADLVLMPLQALHDEATGANAEFDKGAYGAGSDDDEGNEEEAEEKTNLQMELDEAIEAATGTSAQTSFEHTAAVLAHTLPHAVLEILCELLSIPLNMAFDASGQVQLAQATIDAPVSGGAGASTSSASTEPPANAASAARRLMTTAAMDACGKAVERSFLGLAGLIAFLRRLESMVVPGSLRDARLIHLLRCVYAAADAAAVGV